MGEVEALQTIWAELDQEGRAPVQNFFVDGKWQASDANVADQPFPLQLHQLRNGLFYYLKIHNLSTHTEACV